MDLIWRDDLNPKRLVSSPWGYLSKRSIVYLNMLQVYVCYIAIYFMGYILGHLFLKPI